jgi:hypothetical protein
MVVEPREFGPWFSLPTPVASSSSSSQPDAPDAETSDQHVQPHVALRLRRGGVRAPESMLSRHASPSVGENDVTPPTVVRVSPVLDSEDGPAEEVAYPSPSQHESSAGS